MKTISLFILPLAGAALVATAADPAKPETPATDNSSLSATKQTSGGLDQSDKAYDAKVGERLARSGSVSTKPEKSLTKGFFQSLNPFAPMKPAPTTPWISRASWNEIATSEHKRTITAVTADTNRELKINVTVWRD